jgi:hypothetical protein
VLGAHVHDDTRAVLGALATALSAALERLDSSWPVLGAVMGVGRSQLARLGAVVGVGRSQLARSHHGGSSTPAEA